jgi:hypothetical protein
VKRLALPFCAGIVVGVVGVAWLLERHVKDVARELNTSDPPPPRPFDPRDPRFSWLL